MANNPGEIREYTKKPIVLVTIVSAKSSILLLVLKTSSSKTRNGRYKKTAIKKLEMSIFA